LQVYGFHCRHIQLAYQLAEDNLIQGGTNRVTLCTDGDLTSE
jgi:hypothetical protein